MIHNLSETHSIIQQYIAELRDVQVQNDRLRFRVNLERIATLAGYEISKLLEWEEFSVSTPLGESQAFRLKRQPVICSILRAGLALHHGLLHCFDHADNAFISAYRKHDKKGNFKIEFGYLTSPDITGCDLIIADPMLATGASMALTIKKLSMLGKPENIHVVTAIAALPGIRKIEDEVSDVHLWIGAIDEKLSKKFYIIPGLGDAGDLAYGEKIQA